MITTDWKLNDGEKKRETKSEWNLNSYLNGKSLPLVAYDDDNIHQRLESHESKTNAKPAATRVENRS